MRKYASAMTAEAFKLRLTPDNDWENLRDSACVSKASCVCGVAGTLLMEPQPVASSGLGVYCHEIRV